ncbi:uncharacterized protein N7487_010497 [Penicillium crustosum]|uniref:uncharacterized protein n=1 Tax=Penicillium crustosum TaxID=36656 RepID=UPI0023A114A0|nr:uncharacterized protein N7487_010497 [Penicillium crustosum]KAJ5396194.1 hypothetical protein N7487_010497 [Penicillium crustosum]
MERARLEVTAAGELHSLLKDKGENMSSLKGERRHWLLTEFHKDLRIAPLWMVPPQTFTAEEDFPKSHNRIRDVRS